MFSGITFSALKLSSGQGFSCDYLYTRQPSKKVSHWSSNSVWASFMLCTHQNKDKKGRRKRTQQQWQQQTQSCVWRELGISDVVTDTGMVGLMWKVRSGAGTVTINSLLSYVRRKWWRCLWNEESGETNRFRKRENKEECRQDNCSVERKQDVEEQHNKIVTEKGR